MYQDLLSSPENTEFIWNTRFIDFGHPSAAPFLISGWEKQKEDVSVSGTMVSGAPKVSLFFYSLNAGKKQIKVRCRTMKNSKLTMVPLVNRERLKPQKIGPAFVEYVWDVEPEMLVVGRNALAFLIRKSSPEENPSQIVFDYVAISSEGSGLTAQQLAAEEKRLGKMIRAAVKKESENPEGIVTPVPSSVSVYFEVPQDGRLEIDYGIVRTPSSKGSSANFAIYLEKHEGARQAIESEALSYRFFSDASGQVEIPAQRFANQIVRMTLETAPVAGEKTPEQIYWQSFLVREKASSNAQGQDNSKNKKKANIFFYLIDAARADHFQTYGYPKKTSPKVEEFARDAVVFENAYAHSSWTRPAVASILTGLHPSAHGVRDRIDMLSESIPTVQALLKQTGYHNFGFTAQPNVSTTFRFERNFDVFRLIKKDQNRQAQSDRVYSEFKNTVEKIIPQPAFFYVHVIDPHRPYLPLPQFENAFDNCRQEEKKDDQERKECAVAQYDSLILQSDHYFGKWIDLLKQQGLYEDALIVLTADHGESFWEHGEFGHGKSLYETEIRVPLIVHFPGSNFRGKRVKGIARHIDLFPTILQAAGINPSAIAPQAVSLRDLVSEKEPQDRPVLSDLSLDGRREQSLVYRGYKLIAKGQTPRIRYHLFHLKNDPGENNNIAGQESILFGFLKTKLNELQAGEKYKAEKAVLDPETEEMLKGLGYLQ